MIKYKTEINGNKISINWDSNEMEYRLIENCVRIYESSYLSVICDLFNMRYGKNISSNKNNQVIEQ